MNVYEIRTIIVEFGYLLKNFNVYPINHFEETIIPSPKQSSHRCLFANNIETTTNKNKYKVA